MSNAHSNQTEYKSRRNKLFIVSVFVMIFVLITSTVLGLRLCMFVANAKNADSSISISADDSVSEAKKTDNNKNMYSGIEIKDENRVWSSYNNIELFKASYKNDSSVVTVKSADGKNIIAPGTENSYTFNIINTGKTALKYDVTLKSDVMSSADCKIPIEVRIKDYNGNYCVGSYDKWISLEDVDTVAKSITLSPNNYEQYSLEWRWQFENESNEYDTLLGMLEVDEEIRQNVDIIVTAELETEPKAHGGIPYTGDDSNIVLWITVASISLAALFILLVFGNRKNDKNKGKIDNEI